MINRAELSDLLLLLTIAFVFAFVVSFVIDIQESRQKKIDRALNPDQEEFE